MSDPQILLELRRNEREVLRVSVTSFKGKAYADLRLWYTDSEGLTKPSRSGVTLRREAVPGVLDALQQAMELLDGPA